MQALVLWPRPSTLETNGGLLKVKCEVLVFMLAFHVKNVLDLSDLTWVYLGKALKPILL